MCSKGYPDEFQKNVVIENLDNIKLNTNEYLFHAGTLNRDEKIYAIGWTSFKFCINF
jgi:phosphoribosylamine--glycine ligase